jgi:hypothetical protein
VPMCLSTDCSCRDQIGHVPHRTKEIDQATQSFSGHLSMVLAGSFCRWASLDFCLALPASNVMIYTGHRTVLGYSKYA